MRYLHLLALPMVLALLLGIAWFSRDLVAAQEKPAQVLQKWEYKILSLWTGSEDEEKLNKLGTDGWELCAVRSDRDGVAIVYLKRLKR